MAEYEYFGMEMPKIAKAKQATRKRLKPTDPIPEGLTRVKLGAKFKAGDVLYIKWFNRRTGIDTTKVEFLGSNEIV